MLGFHFIYTFWVKEIVFSQLEKASVVFIPRTRENIAMDFCRMIFFLFGHLVKMQEENKIRFLPYSWFNEKCEAKKWVLVSKVAFFHFNDVG